MYIHLTEAARNQLASSSLDPQDHIRLAYDAEGCGCAVSGVASLWLVNEKEADEVVAETNTTLPLTYLARHEIFFEDRLRLDYLTERRAYRLFSDGQIYGNGITVIDRRVSKTATADASR